MLSQPAGVHSLQLLWIEPQVQLLELLVDVQPPKLLHLQQLKRENLLLEQQHEYFELDDVVYLLDVEYFFIELFCLLLLHLNIPPFHQRPRLCQLHIRQQQIPILPPITQPLAQPQLETCPTL